jgi:uncharacterized membrane protein
MRKIFFASAVSLLFVLGGSLTYATGPENAKETKLVSFSGVITDSETGESLAGVLVKIEDTGNVAYTDFDGKFEISDLAPGKYNVNTSMISYQSNKIDIELNGEKTDDLQIKLNQVELK